MYIPWNEEDDLNIEYKECVVTFIDILGFKRMVEESTANPGVRDEIFRSLREINEVVRDRGVRDLNEREQIDDFEVRSFSDLIVRFRPLTGEIDREFAIFREVLDLCFAQASLLERGTLIRGGMTVGNLHYDDAHVFGPGLLRAYELENRLAIYPRIITELGFSRNFQRFTNGDFPFIEEDSDGTPYLSYLSPNTFYSFGTIASASLRHAQAAIKLNLQETRPECAADRQKLLWVCGKFNKMIEELVSIDKRDREWHENWLINPGLHAKS